MATASVPELDTLSLFSDSSHSSGEDRTRKFECLICLELLFRPKILQCYGAHTFCEKCLQKHIDDNSHVDRSNLERYFYCPACKGQVLVPKKGAEGFQTNYYISDDLDRLRAANLERKCDICSQVNAQSPSSSRKASRRCCDCNNMLCKTCSKMHSSNFPTHNVQRMQSRSVSDLDIALLPRENDDPGTSGQTQRKLLVTSSSAECPRQKSSKCSAHPNEELRFFCRGNSIELCGTAICRDCRMTDHFRHDSVTDLSKMVEQSRDQLQNYEAEIHTRLRVCRERKQALQARREGVQSSKTQVETLLEARSKALISVITEHKDQARALLDSQAEETLEKMTEELDLTQAAQLSLQDTLESAQRTLRSGRDVDTIRVSADLGRQLQHEEKRSECGSLATRGFLLNSTGPVAEIVSGELLDYLVGKLVKL